MYQRAAGPEKPETETGTVITQVKTKITVMHNLF